MIYYMAVGDCVALIACSMMLISISRYAKQMREERDEWRTRYNVTQIEYNVTQIEKAGWQKRYAELEKAVLDTKR